MTCRSWADTAGIPALDTVDAHFGELFGQGNFLLIIKDQAGLLLTVPERHIMNFDMVGEVQAVAHLLRKIPAAGKPVFHCAIFFHSCESYSFFISIGPGPKSEREPQAVCQGSAFRDRIR